LPDCFTLKSLGFNLDNFQCSTDLPTFPYKPYWYVHYFAQLLTIHDCLNRVSGRSRWAGFMNFDEFMLPKMTRYFNSFVQHPSQKIEHNSLVGFQFACMDFVCPMIFHLTHSFGKRSTVYCSLKLEGSHTAMLTITVPKWW
jgi:hypothetical protein